MDSNKTLNCNGTYSTSTVWTDWENPQLSSNGTMGDSSSACSSTIGASQYPAWHAFNKDTTSSTGHWGSNTASVSYPVTLTYYSPTPVKVTSIHIYNRYNYRVGFTSGSVKVSNNGSSWTTVQSKSTDDSSYSSSWNNSNTTYGKSGGNWYIYLNNSTTYKYYQISFSSGYFTSTVYPSQQEVILIGQTGTTSYSYYWDKSIT